MIGHAGPAWRARWSKRLRQLVRCARPHIAMARRSLSLTCRGLRSTREWFYNRTNVDRTLAALQVLTAEFTQPSYGDSVIAIEVLNEPFPQADWEMDFLKTFYLAAYDTVRAAAKHPNVVVAIDTAFNGLTTWDGFMTEPGWSGVALDTVRTSRPAKRAR